MYHSRVIKSEREVINGMRDVKGAIKVKQLRVKHVSAILQQELAWNNVEVTCNTIYLQQDELELVYFS